MTEHLSRNMFRAGAAGVAVLAVVGGCDTLVNNGKAASIAERQIEAWRGVPKAAPPPPKGTAPPPAASSYEAAFNTFVSQKMHGKAGIAWAPLGRDGKVTRLGDEFQKDPAWSTSKVPVAVAATAAANDKPDAATQQDLQKAITASDNDAANRLWARLGPPDKAAKATEAVLRAAGDPSVVQYQVVRAGMATTFGQTEWSLSNQAQFAARLPCVPHSQNVLGLMGNITPAQRWGIGQAGVKAAFKDGWGPDPNGKYLTRQLAIVELPNNQGQIGLAMASKPDDGSFETGKTDITELAKWAVANLRGVGTAAPC